MNHMIRKQVYIEPEQDELLKKRAKELGVTESDLIRRSIDQFTRAGIHPPRDPAAWQRQVALFDELQRRAEQAPAGPTDAGTWSREEIYDERLRRFLG